MCFGGGGADKVAKQQRADEQARQARISAGMGSIAAAFGGFDDGYYAKRAKDYVDFATPAVEKQGREAHDQLIYALSRTGNLDSSAAIKRNADLTDEINTQRIGIADEGLNQANAARTKVEGVRSNLVAELNATGDSSASADAALRQTANLNQPQGYSPLTNLFASFASTLGDIGSRASNGYSGLVGSSRPLFATASRGSQRVVG